MHNEILGEGGKCHISFYFPFILPFMAGSELCHCYHRHLSFSVMDKKRMENKMDCFKI